MMAYRLSWTAKGLLMAAGIYLFVLAMSGCASLYSAQTKVHVETTPDGACTADYSSGKEQEKIQATICGGDIKTAHSGTMESAVAAALEMNSLLLKELLPLLRAGAMSGS